jgi:hypothetical protein
MLISTLLGIYLLRCIEMETETVTERERILEQKVKGLEIQVYEHRLAEVAGNIVGGPCSNDEPYDPQALIKELHMLEEQLHERGVPEEEIKGIEEYWGLTPQELQDAQVGLPCLVTVKCSQT